MTPQPPDQAIDGAPPKDLRVSLTIPAALTQADKDWAMDNPDKVNAHLANWYRHARKCRRSAARRGDTLATGISKCGCFG
jgi:hypothetical protein